MLRCLLESEAKGTRNGRRTRTNDALSFQTQCFHYCHLIFNFTEVCLAAANTNFISVCNMCSFVVLYLRFSTVFKTSYFVEYIGGVELAVAIKRNTMLTSFLIQCF